MMVPANFFLNLSEELLTFAVLKIQIKRGAPATGLREGAGACVTKSGDVPLELDAVSTDVRT